MQYILKISHPKEEAVEGKNLQNVLLMNLLMI